MTEETDIEAHVRVYNDEGFRIVSNRMNYAQVEWIGAERSIFDKMLPFRLRAFLAFLALFYAGYFFSHGTMNGPAAIIFGALSGFALFLVLVGD